MTIEQLQFLKDSQTKAEKVISSCQNLKQYISAKKYIRLLERRYGEEFNLEKMFKLNIKDYHLCRDILFSLETKLQVQRQLVTKI